MTFSPDGFLSRKSAPLKLEKIRVYTHRLLSSPFGASYAVLYRAEGDSYPDCGTSFYINAYEIVEYTPCGAWIYVDCKKKKWVNLKGVRCFAYATKEEALYSLKRRKQRHVAILASQLASAERVLEALNDMYDSEGKLK